MNPLKWLLSLIWQPRYCPDCGAELEDDQVACGFDVAHPADVPDPLDEDDSPPPWHDYGQAELCSECQEGCEGVGCGCWCHGEREE